MKTEVEAVYLGLKNNHYPGSFHPPVIKIIKSIIGGDVLHLFSGDSPIGMERVDSKSGKATVKAEVSDFISEDNRDWDWVILDPPYNIVLDTMKLKGYGSVRSVSSNKKLRNQLRHYFQQHASNVLWLDFCAPTIPGFHRQKLWLCLPGGFHTVRVLSWLKREMKLLL